MEKTTIFNSVKRKLLEGKQVVGGTIQTPDPNIYLAMANSGFDFIWIEMQHSPMTYQDAAKMIWAGRDSPAIPFIRVPDATEGDIQKATDIGALGIIVPMVNNVSKIEKAIKYSSFPPVGERSQGGGQYFDLWGENYRKLANENILIVAQIESPSGVCIVESLVHIDGLDIIMVASTDLASFSGFNQGDDEYEKLVSRVTKTTLSSGKILGGPYAWKKRNGFKFLQGPSAEELLSRGVKNLLLEESDGFAKTEGSRS